SARPMRPWPRRARCPSTGPAADAAPVCAMGDRAVSLSAHTSTRGRMPVGQIEIEPEALLNAASALEKIVRPDLDQATDKFANSYRVDPPGWGIALSP